MRLPSLGLGLILALAPVMATAQNTRSGAAVSFEKGTSDKSSLKQAFEAAFAMQLKPGSPLNFSRSVSGRGLISFEPVALYRIHDGLWALLSTGTPDEQGHSSTGINAIHYLRGTAGHWQKAGEWFDLGSTGTWGNGATEWKFTRGLGKNPYLLTSAGGTWQGCTVSQAVLTELAPTGPTDRGTFTDHNSWADGAPGRDFSYNGTITSSARDRSFTVTYTGTKRLAEQYVRQGDEYKIVGKSQIPGC